MAMTAAEKMKAYRERLKEKGGPVSKQIGITLTPAEIQCIELITKLYFPDKYRDGEFNMSGMIREILLSVSRRVVADAKECIKLQENDSTLWRSKLYLEKRANDFINGSPYTAESYLADLKIFKEEQDIALKAAEEKLIKQREIENGNIAD